MADKKTYIYIGRYSKHKTIKIGYCTVTPVSRQSVIRVKSGDKSYTNIAYIAINGENKPLGLKLESDIRYAFSTIKGYKYLDSAKNNDHFKTIYGHKRNIADFKQAMEQILSNLGIEDYEMVIKG